LEQNAAAAIQIQHKIIGRGLHIISDQHPSTADDGFVKEINVLQRKMQGLEQNEDWLEAYT
jgi:hypothetical protein